MKKRFLTYCCTALVAFGATGCSDFFNPDMEDSMYEEDYMKVYTELYSGYMGIATTVQEVAEKSIFLEGLRGDLLEPTRNAPQEFWDVYNYESNLQGNSLADPVGYYKVILHANDYIKHAFEYQEEFPNGISDELFSALIGGALRYKAWAYLMLAKIYGEAIYLDDPLGSYQDISKYPMWEFDLLINKCIDLIETGVNGVNGKGEVRWSTELFPGQSENTDMLTWNRLCPPADVLLAELYLWKQNYPKSYQHCLSLLHTGANDGTCYMINYSEYLDSWIDLHKKFVRKEHICIVFYDYEQQQTNNVLRYFSNISPNLYYMAPSAAARNRFETQLRPSDVGDINRGQGTSTNLGKQKSYYQDSGGNWIFNKFLNDRNSNDTHKSDIPICLYRASDLHLFMIEALVGMGRFEEALVFLNGGIEAYFDVANGVFKAPFEAYPTQLYSTRGDKSNMGVRGRAGLAPVGTSALNAPNIDIDVDKRMLDSLLVVETCLESAGEARSHYAMVRMSRKWPSMRSHWAEAVANKYPDGGGRIRAMLEADEKNWFIHYDLYDEE